MRSDSRRLQVRRTLAALAAATAAAGALPVHAATGPSLHITAGYPGVPIAPGYWVPVTVQIDGGDTGVSGTLRITPPPAPEASPVTQVVAVDVGSGDKRTVTVAVRSIQGAVVADLRSSTGASMAQATAQLKAGSDGHVFIAVLAPRGAFDKAAGTFVLGGQTQSVDFVGLTPTTLPDTRTLLATFNEVVVDGLPTGALTPAQREALSGYVESGGGLAVAGGDAAAQAVEGIPSSLLAATPGAVVAGTLPTAVASLCTAPGLPPPVQASVDQSALALSRGATAAILDSAGRAIIASRTVGLGRTVMADFDPLAAPVATWPQQPCLLRELLAAALPGRIAEVAMEPTAPRGAKDTVIRHSPDRDTIPAELTDAATAMVVVLPPPLAMLAAALGAYVLVAGPLAALAFRSPRRRPLLWAVIPSLAVIAGGAAWTTGLGVARVDPVATQVRILDLGPGTPSGTGPVEALTTLSLPRGGDARLALPDGAHVEGLTGAGETQSDADGLAVTGAPAATLRRVLVDWDERPSGGVNATLRWTDDIHLEGTIANRLPVDLRDTRLLGSDGSLSPLGRINRGASIRATVVAGTALGGGEVGAGGCGAVSCTGRDAAVLDGLAQWAELAHPGIPMLLGVAARPLLPTAEPQTTLDTVVVPLRAPDDSDAPLALRGLTTQAFQGGGVVYGAAITLRDGDFSVLDTPIPPGADTLHVSPLSGSCWTLGCVSYRVAPSSNPLPPAVLYDWLDPATGTWRPLPPFTGPSGHTSASLPAAWLHGGDLLLRLRAQNLAVSLAAPDVRASGGGL
jgi:hypothetical protein